MISGNQELWNKDWAPSSSLESNALIIQGYDRIPSIIWKNIFQNLGSKTNVQYDYPLCTVWFDTTTKFQNWVITQLSW